MGAGLGVIGVGAAVDAQAQPGPFPQWCPGEFWDPGWGDNWDGGHCHDNSVLGGITMTVVVGMTTATAARITTVAGITAEVTARPDKNTPADGGGVL